MTHSKKIIFTLLSIVFLSSCTNMMSEEPQSEKLDKGLTINSVLNADDLAKGGWRYLTEEEYERLRELGYWDNTKITCGWSDGVGGSMNCPGGRCVPVDYNNYIGIVCEVGGVPQRAGVFRPAP